MGNPQTLVDFVSWSKTNYPADHYALYFWGHGWSWHPGVVMQDDTNADTLDYHEMKPIMNTLGLHRRRRLRRLQHGLDRDRRACGTATRPRWPPRRNGSAGTASSTTWCSTQLDANPNMTADQVGGRDRRERDRTRRPSRRSRSTAGGTRCGPRSTTSGSR